jgi:hypothetical protein
MTPSQSIGSASPSAGNGSPDSLPDGSHSEWERRVCGLQQCVCELLIKNQQLRIALMELKATQTQGMGTPGGPCAPVSRPF